MRTLTSLRAAVAVVATLLASIADAQAPAPAAASDMDRAKAAALLTAQDWAGAASAYEVLVRKYPNEGPLWARLGIAYRAQSKLDSAAIALERAIALGVPTPQPHVELARVRARQGNTAAALGHLEKAVTAGLGAPQVLTTQADFESIKGNPKFVALIERVTAARYPCRTDSLFHQFDFWIGTWDVRVAAGPAGTNEITSLLDQCLVLENWTDRFGGQGKSMNFYDTNTRKWRQIWVSDNGGSLDYSGSFRDGAMRFEGATVGPNGARTLQRLTFFPVARDTVRQLFESSSDNGATWTAGFDGMYVRKR
jgi:hypothetical protein